MSDTFVENFYLQAKLEQLHRLGELDANGNSFTIATLKQAISNAGLTPQAHYELFGRSEGLRPNSSFFDTKLDFDKSVYFNESAYLQNKADAMNASEHTTSWNVNAVRTAIYDAGMTIWEHFHIYGAYETNADGGIGINPSKYFDLDRYYTDKLEQVHDSGEHYSKSELVGIFRAAELDPLSHYSLYGFSERVTPVMDSIDKIPYTVSRPGRAIFPLSSDYKIDSLLHDGYVDWNGYGKEHNTNALYYYFSQTPSSEFYFTDSFDTFDAKQKETVRTAAKYLSDITGINFQETTNANQANFCFFEATQKEAGSYIGWAVTSNMNDYKVGIVIRNPTSYTGIPNQDNFSLILHEWGHALGLKHPFESNIVLPASEDNWLYTRMAYIMPEGPAATWYSQINGSTYYSPYDLMALNYLYGADGLNGNEGLVSGYASTGVWDTMGYAATDWGIENTEDNAILLIGGSSALNVESA
jgi:hypothetical protein